MKSKKYLNIASSVAIMALCFSISTARAGDKPASSNKKEVKQEIRKAASTGAEINLGGAIDKVHEQLALKAEEMHRQFVGSYTVTMTKYSDDGKTADISMKHPKTGKTYSLGIPDGKVSAIKGVNKAEIVWKNNGLEVIYYKPDGSVALSTNLFSLTTIGGTAPDKTASIEGRAVIGKFGPS